MTGARPDVVEVLTSDHRLVDQLFHQFELASSTEAYENQRDLAQKLVRELSVHSVAEEQVLYPVMRRVLENGDRLADECLEAHAELKRLLADLDGIGPHDEGFVSGFTQLAALVREHVVEEEGLLLPQLQEAVDAEELLDLGAAVEQAKRLAPTRPQPHAPNRPPGNIVAGALAAVADNARDLVRDFRTARP